MRLIDADAIGLNDFEIILCDGSYKEALKMLLNKIETAPTVEERKTGKWRICTEEIEETFHTGSRCTVCNYWKPMGIWKYCPNCGAKME